MERTKIITKEQYLQLEGLKSLYTHHMRRADEIMETFAAITHEEDAEDAYDGGGFILLDNYDSEFNLKKKLKDINIEVEKNGNKK